VGTARSGSLRALLFPRPPRAFRGARAWQVGARTVHIAAMGLLLGGVAFRVPVRELVVPVGLTVASGLVLLGIDLWKSCAYVYQGNGVAVLLKLALLGLGMLFPSARLEWYLAATVIASIGSHMPKTWRHWSLLDRKVLETG
jgi:hypothetical protein